MENNYPAGAKDRTGAPYNDDSMDCECGNVLDSFSCECNYCDGIGVVSEYHYNDIKSLEREESDL